MDAKTCCELAQEREQEIYTRLLTEILEKQFGKVGFSFMAKGFFSQINKRREEIRGEIERART